MFGSFPTVAIHNLAESYDYVVVGTCAFVSRVSNLPDSPGGGTAGCVLANRLSQDGGTSVLLIERGGVQDSWISRIPLLSSSFASDGTRTRIWKSTPQTHANGRVFELAGGKSLGGSSRINSMLYTRGVPAEYNSWAQDGRQGWGYDDLQPYFKKSETDLDQRPGSESDFHGVAGRSAWIKDGLGL